MKIIEYIDLDEQEKLDYYSSYGDCKIRDCNWSYIL